jgi:hypothetical protein
MEKRIFIPEKCWKDLGAFKGNPFSPFPGKILSTLISILLVADTMNFSLERYDKQSKT